MINLLPADREKTRKAAGKIPEFPGVFPTDKIWIVYRAGIDLLYILLPYYFSPL
jgi:hypothetical protein